MARLIVKSPYIKCGGGQSAGGYMKYIATRERVEIIPDDRPPTRKQEQLITKLVKIFLTPRICWSTSEPRTSASWRKRLKTPVRRCGIT